MNIEDIRESLKPAYIKAKSAQKNRIIMFIIAGMLAITFLIGTFRPLLAFITIMLSVLISEFTFNKEIKRYKNEIKQTVLPKIFSMKFDNVIFNHYQGFDKQLMRDTAVIDLGQDYVSEDYLSGTYKGIPFERVDIYTSTTTTTSTGNSTTTTTHVYFRGQAYRFRFNKSIENYIRIRERRGFFSKFSKGKNIKGSRKIIFEDVSFNDNFHAVTNDEHTAFYVVTPQFMMRLKNLIARVDGDMSFVIEDDSLYVAVYNNENSFELSGIREVDEEFVRNILAQVSLIEHVVDGLDLTHDLFKEGI